MQVQRLDVPNEGCMVWLRNFGQVKLFRARPKDPLRYDVVGLPDGQGDSTFARLDFQKRHDQHWGIEQYHRLRKQVCNVERFQVRGKVPILNPIFAARPYLDQSSPVEKSNTQFLFARMTIAGS